MDMKYFKNVRSLKDLKAQYRRLAMENHPDAGGDADTPFGSKAWVLVRMDGATEVINARYSRLKVIYKNMGFNAEALENKLQYLPTK